MPHSSGGGGHGGGHGGHGGHGGFRGGRSVPRRPRNYVCYIHGRRCVRSLTEDPSVTRHGYIVGAAITFVIFVILLGITLEYCIAPAKMRSGYKGAIINDEAALLGDTTELRTYLDDFGEKTGITVAIETVYSDEYSGSLENYAYNRYLEIFDNEDSWLLVVSCLRSDPGNSDYWLWEGMQGNNTDRILWEETLEPFNYDIQSDLYHTEKGDVASVFNRAFYTYGDDVMATTPEFAPFIPLAICGGIILLLVILTIRSYKIYGKNPQEAKRGEK